jgi:hypothetical protein
MIIPIPHSQNIWVHTVFSFVAHLHLFNKNRRRSNTTFNGQFVDDIPNISMPDELRWFRWRLQIPDHLSVVRNFINCAPFSSTKLFLDQRWCFPSSHTVWTRFLHRRSQRSWHCQVCSDGDIWSVSQHIELTSADWNQTKPILIHRSILDWYRPSGRSFCWLKPHLVHTERQLFGFEFIFCSRVAIHESQHNRSEKNVMDFDCWRRLLIGILYCLGIARVP